MSTAAMLGLTAATVAAVAGVVVVWWHRPVAALVLAMFTAALGQLSAVDLRERRLPNRVVGPLALATVAWAVAASLADGSPGRAALALVAGVVASAGFLAVGLVGQVGMGDVKLAFPVGVMAGWLGLGAVQVTVLATALSAFVAGVAVLATGRGRRYGLPFGVFLALGSVAGILLAPRL